MTYVEIGANDGLHMSNSYFFERYLGWRGMCVEANPHTYRQLRRHRPRCVNVNALVKIKNPSLLLQLQRTPPRVATKSAFDRKY